MEEEILNSNVGVEEESANSENTTAVENTDEAKEQVADVPKVEEVEVKKDENDVNGNVGKKQEYTDLEKAQYSFRKQFARQRQKYESQIDDMRKAFEERLDRLEHPEKYAPKLRDDFKTDDEFINHLVEQKFQKMLMDSNNAYEKQQKEQAERDEITSEYRNRVEENVKVLYPTDAEQQEYRKVVQEALDEGLGELIEKDNELAQYIMLSPMGPSIMYKLATDNTAVDNLFNHTTPMSRQFKIRELETSLKAEFEQKKLQANSQVVSTQPKEAPKVVGKPGVQTTAKKNIWEDDDALEAYLDSKH